MKLIILFLLACSFLMANSVFARNSYLIPPFENFSRYKSSTSYKVRMIDHDDPSKSTVVEFPIDQYSEIGRSLLEDRLVNLGAKVLERTRFDQLMNESKLSRNQGYVNEQSALEMGKLIGANTLVMGSILGFQVERKRINVYGIKRDMTNIICSIRIRVINIESGDVDYSFRHKGKYVIQSSNNVARRVESEISPALDDAVLNIRIPDRLKSDLQDE